MGRELWLRVTPELSVRMAILTVKDGQVLVDEASLAMILGDGVHEDGSGEPWSITYGLMKELLDVQGFRYWGELG